MVNSWSLLYDELYGDDGMSEKNETKNDNGEDSNSDTIVFGDTTIAGGEGSDILEIHGAGDYFPGKYDWNEDGFSLTGNPTACADTISLGNSAFVGSRIAGGMGQDHISFNPGLANTVYDEPKYYSDIHGIVAGDDPYPTLGTSITGSRVQGGMGIDTINLSPYPHAPFNKVPELSINKPGVHKYEEDKGIADLKNYVASTYNGHYTTKGSNVQTLDLIESVGYAESFCRSNAIKYLSRYDKKGQAKRDILKAMHYCLLLYYFSGNTQNEITTRGYETF